MPPHLNHAALLAGAGSADVRSFNPQLGDTLEAFWDPLVADTIVLGKTSTSVTRQYLYKGS